MSSSEILASRTFLLPFRPTLGTRSPAYPNTESCHIADIAAIFTVCLCTAKSGQRDAVFVDRNMDLDAADLLATIDAALKAARRRAAGSTVDHHSTRLWRIATSKAPAAASGSRASLPKP